MVTTAYNNILSHNITYKTEQNRTCDDKDIIIDDDVVVSLPICLCGRLSVCFSLVDRCCIFVFCLCLCLLFALFLCQCAFCLFPCLLCRRCGSPVCSFGVLVPFCCVSSSLCVDVCRCVYLPDVCVFTYGVSLCVCVYVSPCQCMCLSLWLKLFLDSMCCGAVPFSVGLVVVSFMTPCVKSKFVVLWEEYGRCVET